MNQPQPPQLAAQSAPPAPKKRGMPTWAIVLLALVGAMVLILPVFSVLAIYGVRKYLANAKTAEARNAVSQMAKDAATAYDPKRGFCPSATRPVPTNVSAVSGAKYQSTPAEWEADRAQNGGFACLKFSMEEPQYFQYSYVGGRTSFEAVARGDLNGDGVTSTYRVRGRVGPGGVVSVEPNIEEENPGE